MPKFSSLRRPAVLRIVCLMGLLTILLMSTPSVHAQTTAHLCFTPAKLAYSMLATPIREASNLRVEILHALDPTPVMIATHKAGER